MPLKTLSWKHFLMILISFLLCFGQAIEQKISSTSKESPPEEETPKNNTLNTEDETKPNGTADVQAAAASDVSDVPSKTSSNEQLRQDDAYAVKEKGNTCILIKLDAQFSIEYKVKGQKTRSVNPTLLDDETSSGSCGTDSKPPEVSITWQFYTVSFTFDKVTDDQRWFVKSIRLTYNPALAFNEPTLEKSETVASKDGETFMETPMNSSYACSEPEKYTLYDENGAVTAYAVIDSIKVQAYIPGTDAFGIEYPCGSKPETEQPKQQEEEYPVINDTVPIAVGSTLAMITILVVAAYAIYRSLTVKKLDYATMEE